MTSEKEMRLIFDDLLALSDFGDPTYYEEFGYSELSNIIEKGDTLKSNVEEFDPHRSGQQSLSSSNKNQIEHRGHGQDLRKVTTNMPNYGKGRGSLVKEILNTEDGYSEEFKRRELLKKINSAQYRNETIENRYYEQLRKNQITSGTSAGTCTTEEVFSESIPSPTTESVQPPTTESVQPPTTESVQPPPSLIRTKRKKERRNIVLQNHLKKITNAGNDVSTTIQVPEPKTLDVTAAFEQIAFASSEPEMLDVTAAFEQIALASSEPEVLDEVDCMFYEDAEEVPTSSTSSSATTNSDSLKKKGSHKTSQRRRFQSGKLLLGTSSEKSKNTPYVYEPNLRDDNFKFDPKDFPKLA